jgi:serine/threonine-protein kinase
MKECPRCQACFDDYAESCPRDGSPLERSLKGSRLIDGKYQIECLLGRGGMGAVYRVRHLGLEKQFALKLILPSVTIRKRFLEEFQSEARVLGRLKHNNIVEVTDYGLDARDGGTPYLVMEYLDGSTLKARLQESGPLATGDLLPLLDQVARAIDYAHGQGILHCDIKPANVFLHHPAGHAPIVKILDFGLALLFRTRESERGGRDRTVTPSDLARVPCGPDQETRADSSQDSTLDFSRETADAQTAQPVGPRGIRGTLAYMAPEILSGGQPTSATDMYAFGALVYEMVVGRLPFVGTPREIARGHLELPAPRPSTLGLGIAKEIEAALLAPLEKAPGRRPRNARDAVSAVRSAYYLVEKRNWRAREFPRRLGLAALFAPILALLSIASHGIGPMPGLDKWTIDARFTAQPRQEPDRRILIVSVDDATLAADQTLMGERADEFARQLERVFAAGAEGIGIDFLLPFSWSRSAAFSRFVLRHADGLTLAAFSTPTGETVGTECLAGLTAAALGPARLGSLFGFVNLDEDVDGVTRRARLSYAGRTGEKLETWAARSAKALTGRLGPVRKLNPGSETFWVNYAADWQRFDRISWLDLPRQLDADPSIFEGRLVLVGGEFVAAGDDFHRVPAGGHAETAVSGIVLEALIVNTILSGFPFKEMQAPWNFLVLGITSLLLMGAALCLSRLSEIACVFGAVVFVCVFFGFALFRWSGLILPVACLFLSALFALGSGLLVRSRLAAFPSQDTET